MLRKLFFRAGIVAAVVGVLLIVVAFTVQSKNYWEPGFTGFMFLTNAIIYIFISYCMRLTGYSKWFAVASGALLFAGLCLQSVTQAGRFFFDVLLIDWRMTDALTLSGFKIALALLIAPGITLITKKQVG